MQHKIDYVGLSPSSGDLVCSLNNTILDFLTIKWVNVRDKVSPFVPAWLGT